GPGSLPLFLVGDSLIKTLVGHERIPVGVEAQPCVVAETVRIRIGTGEGFASVRGFPNDGARAGRSVEVVHAIEQVVSIGGIDGNAGFTLRAGLIADVGVWPDCGRRAWNTRHKSRGHWDCVVVVLSNRRRASRANQQKPEDRDHGDGYEVRTYFHSQYSPEI